MCDLLMKSARAYRMLENYAYTIIGGRKGSTITVQITFPEDAFHHLAGFHHTRIDALKGQKTALANIISSGVTFAQLLGNGFTSEDRLEAICTLQESLENNKLVFRYRNHEQPFSKIKAEYMFTWGNNMFFIDNGIPVSIFENKKHIDYTSGCPRFTVLQIKRKYVKTGKEIIIYQRDGYNP